MTNPIIIPAGATQALVSIVALADNLVEGTENVIVSIVPPPCAAVVPLPPECYEVGSPAQATVNINDNASNTNRAPIAFWLTPTNGSTFLPGASILLRASANDLDGSLARVEFRRGTNLIGTATGPGTNYTTFWTNPPVGTHSLFAVAVDNLNARGTSAPVTITIQGTVNPAPTVTITRPVDGAILPRADVLIEAVTQDANGYADTVEFFADSQKIGESQILFIQAPPPGTPINFEFTWTNPPAGEHVLQARTTDNNGARGTSAPVYIIIQGSAVVVHPAPRDQKEPSVASTAKFTSWFGPTSVSSTTTSGTFTAPALHGKGKCWIPTAFAFADCPVLSTTRWWPPMVVISW